MITGNHLVLQSGFHLGVALCERDNTCLAVKKKEKKRIPIESCHTDLKRKKNSNNLFSSVKKEMVNWDDIFIFRHKAQVCGERTPVPSDLADSAI